MKRMCLLFAAGLLLTFGTCNLFADVISDAVFVTDTQGLYKFTGSLTEAQEAAGMLTITLNIPQKTVTLGPNENGSGSPSDTLVIDPFTVALKSDLDSPPPVQELAEQGVLTLRIFAASDPSLGGCPPGGPSDLSDCLVVNGTPLFLSETQEMGGTKSIKFGINPFSEVLGANENGTGKPSDTASVTGFNITLTSDYPEPPTEPTTEGAFNDTLTVTFQSDVPEPSTILPITGIALAAVAFRFKRRKRAA